MGIKGLETLLDSTKYKRAWSEDPIKDNLVIDGNNLCHELYSNLDRLNGGEYPEYHKKVLDFFKRLCDKDITLHVVFDGVAKVDTLNDDAIFVKKNSKDNPFPSLAYPVFYDVLRDQSLNIETYVADGEGDDLCVKLANRFNCPVLSGDTDFVLYNLDRGYCRLCELNINEIVTARVLCQDALVAVKFVREKDFLFLIPAILKNKVDKMSLVEEVLGLSVDEESQLELVLSHISRFASVSSFFKSIKDTNTRETVMLRYKRAKTLYTTSRISNLSELHTTSLQTKCQDLPEWFVRKYHECSIPHFLVDAKVNQRQHHSGSLVSEHIRQCCYKILGIKTVSEYQYDKKVEKITSKDVPCAVVECPNLCNIAIMHELEREKLLYSMHKIYGCVWCTYPNEDKLFLASVIFWNRQSKVQGTNVPEYVCKALIATYLLCSAGLEAVRSVREHTCQRISTLYMFLSTSSCREDRQHFLDWQSVYQDTMALNSLLMCPLQEKCPSKIYDGKIAIYLTSKSQSIDKEISKLRISEDKYHEFVKILTSS